MMTDMRAAERDQGLYQKVDAFAMGCTLFFLCTGRELYGAGSGAGGTDGTDDCGARTKTKNRAMRAQTLVDGAMDGGDGFGANDVDSVRGLAGTNAPAYARSPDGEDALSFGAKAAALSPALGGLLRARANAAALEDDRRELDVDWKMLASMAEFPGYEPRTEQEISYVQDAVRGDVIAGCDDSRRARVQGEPRVVRREEAVPEAAAGVRRARRRDAREGSAGTAIRGGGARVAGGVGGVGPRRVGESTRRREGKGTRVLVPTNPTCVITSIGVELTRRNKWVKSNPP